MAKQAKPRKPGRPRLPKGEARGRTMQVRFTADEAKRIAATARANGMKVSEWIRSTLNAATI